jgi:hypothetical protein
MPCNDDDDDDDDVMAVTLELPVPYKQGLRTPASGEVIAMV